MTLNDEDMDTYVFAVGTKKAMARLQKEMQDLVNIMDSSVKLVFQNYFQSIVSLLLRLTDICFFSP